MIAKYVIAGGQMARELNKKKKNLDCMISLSHEASREGARLVIFPEWALKKSSLFWG